MNDLLGVSMAEVSTWADEVRGQRRETGPWHYINIPIDAPHTRSADFCSKEGCVVSKIDDLVEILHTSNDRAERAEALKFLIHFVGDMHQPLHCGDRKDRGGNDTKVNYFGQAYNLHRLWDSDLLARMDNDEDHLVHSLLRLSEGLLVALRKAGPKKQQAAPAVRFRRKGDRAPGRPGARVDDAIGRPGHAEGHRRQSAG